MLYFRAEGTRVAGESSNRTPLAPHLAFSANTGEEAKLWRIESQPVGHSELSVDWEPRPLAISVLDPESPEFSLRPTDVPPRACLLSGGSDGPSENTVPGPWFPVATRGQSLPSLRTKGARGGGLFLCT